MTPLTTLQLPLFLLPILAIPLAAWLARRGRWWRAGLASAIVALAPFWALLALVSHLETGRLGAGPSAFLRQAAMISRASLGAAILLSALIALLRWRNRRAGGRGLKKSSKPPPSPKIDSYR